MRAINEFKNTTQKRPPFKECANVIMQTNNESPRIITRSPRKPVPNKKYENEHWISTAPSRSASSKKKDLGIRKDSKNPIYDESRRIIKRKGPQKLVLNKKLQNDNKLSTVPLRSVSSKKKDLALKQKSTDESPRTITRESPRKPVPNKKYQNEYMTLTSSSRSVTSKKKDLNLENSTNSVLKIVLDKSPVIDEACEIVYECDLNDKNRPFSHQENLRSTSTASSTVVSESKTKNLQVQITRQSTPLIGRLRKCGNQNYFESSLEESLIEKPVNNNSNKPKVPIYKQAILEEPKAHFEDPYAIDIIDLDKGKPKKKRNLNLSSKFDKTMYNVLAKIEKNERKKNVRKKIKKSSQKEIIHTSKYDKNMENVLEKVRTKIITTKGAIKNLSKAETESKSCKDVPADIQRTSVGNQKETVTETLDKINESANISNLTINEPSIPLFLLDSSQNNSKSKDNLFEIECQDTPNTRKSKSFSRVNVLSNISLRKNLSHNYTLAKTSLPTDLHEKSQNLQREFNNNSVLNVHPSVLEDTLENDHHFDQFENDGFVEEEEDESTDGDEYFGFKESTGTTPAKISQRIQPTKPLPWRFHGFFKRNPHVLKLKPNGLPCQKQEMVMDYEFVKRIEALSAKDKKHPATARAKSPVQTTMLDYIESDQHHTNNPIRLSLFDYEEFVVAKPRKVLGELQENQIISTPKKDVQTVVESPNVSRIPMDEEIENRVIRSYSRKSPRTRGEENKNEPNTKGDEIEPDKQNEEDMLPEEECGETEDADVHLFEDAEDKPDPDFSIKLPKMKYANKRQRKRQISEGSNGDDEKKTKRRRKDQMTKQEESAFEAWAAKTNARFAEEDKFELTIE